MTSKPVSTQIFLKIWICCAEICHKVRRQIRIVHIVLTSLISGWEAEEVSGHSRFVMKPAGSIFPPASTMDMCSKYRVKIHYEGTDVAQTFTERGFAFF